MTAVSGGFKEGQVGDFLCEKINASGKRNLIPGMFFGTCQHQICYGFHFMGQAEGRKDVFYVLSRYWPAEVTRDFSDDEEAERSQSDL